MLVLICFGSTRPPGPSMALHRNGQRQDNHISNLYWGFADDNARDRESHGNNASGERNGKARLNWELVREIRKLSASGVSVRAIAKKFGCSRGCIQCVVHGVTWKEVAEETEVQIASADASG